MKKYNANDFKDLNALIGTNKNIKSHQENNHELIFNVFDKNIVETTKIKELGFVDDAIMEGNSLKLSVKNNANDVFNQYTTLFPENLVVDSTTSEQEASKVLENYQFNFKKTFMKYINGIMVPVIPALMAAGLLQALFAILVSTGALYSISSSSILKGTIGSDPKSIISEVFFLVTNVSLQFLGFFIGFNTIRFLGGKNVNVVMATLIPLVVSAPHLFLDNQGFKITLVNFGTINDIEMGIYIMGYSSMFLPQIGAAVFYIFLDRWIKSWMPPLFDKIFRNFLTILITGLFTFFVIGSILGLVERSMYLLFSYIQQIPFGFGVGIFGFFWVFIVVSGLHGGLTLAIMSSGPNQPGGSQLLAFTSISGISTIATCLAVAIRAKEADMKNLAVGSLFASIFGTSEPTYYGISMVRPILFLPVAIARGITGMLIGILDIRAYQVGGRGILGFTAVLTDRPGVDVQMALIKIIGAMAVLFSICFVLTLFIYKERKNDKTMFKILYKNLFKKMEIKNDEQVYNDDKNQLKNLINQINTKEFKQLNKDAEKVISKESNTKFKILKNRDKQAKIQEILDHKTKKAEIKIGRIKYKKYRLSLSKKDNSQKLLDLNVKIEKINENLEHKTEIANKKIAKYEKPIKELTLIVDQQHLDTINSLEKLEKEHVKIQKEIQKTFEKSLKNKSETEKNEVDAMIFNAVHNLEINYKLIDKMV